LHGLGRLGRRALLPASKQREQQRSKESERAAMRSGVRS
jgi:hypothetical protein